MQLRRYFLFKPDGIGDFFLASGVVRLMASEFGEENLTLAVLPIMESVVRGQFPKASLILLPLKTKRRILNLFAANCLRCFMPWLTLLQTRSEVAISLRNMRDYLQNFLFFSVCAKQRFLCINPLLGNGRPVRRWTEYGLELVFRPQVLPYPESTPGIPSELEAHRVLVSAALGRTVAIEEIWPELRAVNQPFLDAPYWVCAPYSSGAEKDFPLDRWVTIFLELSIREKLPTLVLTGSSDQRARLENFKTLLAASSESLACRTMIIIPPNLQDFIDLLAAAACVLSVDTAAAHAATALDRPTLILFSGKHQGMFAPWVRSKRQIWLLPKSLESSSEDAQWHTSYNTEEILNSLESLCSP